MTSLSPSPAATNPAESPARRIALGLVCALTTGLSVAAVDWFLTVLDDPALTTRTGVFAPAAAAFAAVFALYLVARTFDLMLLQGSFGHRDPEAAIGLGAAIFTAMTFATQSGAVRNLMRGERIAESVAGPIFIAFVTSIAFYRIAVSWRDMPRARTAMLGLVIAAPVLFTALAAIIDTRDLDMSGKGRIFAAMVIACAIWVGHMIAARRFAAVMATSTGILFVLALSGGAWREYHARDWIDEPENAVGDASRSVRHVVLLTIDTLRADALALYDPENGVPAPAIEALAEDGVVFRNAYAASPWTLPSFVSIMTGLHPLVHRTMEGHDILSDSVRALPDWFREEGYQTAATGRNAFLLRNFNRRFDDYSFYPIRLSTPSLGFALLREFADERFDTDVTTPEITDRAVDWMKANHEVDFFFWLHYYDPHFPYTPPDKYLARKRPLRLGREFDKDLKVIRSGFWVPTPGEAKAVRDLYLAEVRYVDENVARLVARLKRLDLYDDALIVVLSDHGEEFWEHGGFEHGHAMYNELLRVPLIIKPPGGKPAVAQVDRRVTHDQITPTILELCGIRFDPDQFTGRSLAPLLEGEAAAWTDDPLVFAGSLHSEPKEAVIFGDYKYMHSKLTGIEELYNLVDDPGEKWSLAAADKTNLETGRAALESAKDRYREFVKRHGIQGGKARKFSRTETETLKSLGYIN
ncbi:MAG: sulfatase [Deltaproteobacteria bacterium]|nr:sulfatase [Deltaproteobacteria bacterium]